MSKPDFIEPCPACQENGSDKSGNHLARWESGEFNCVVNPGDKQHNRRIIELRPELGKQPTLQDSTSLGILSATYIYRIEQDKPVYEVRRYIPKDFRQYRFENGKPVAGMQGVIRIPYNLPEVLCNQTIWITEGEKDADHLKMAGVVATCNAGGAGKWDSSWNPYFKDKDIILCGDNDDAGRKHIDQVEAALKSVAKSIKRVVVPSPSKDISDLLEGLSSDEMRIQIDKLLIDPIASSLDVRKFDIKRPPPEPRSIFKLCGTTIATPGNLCVIAAQAKAGKTALLGAFIAASVGLPGDKLGVLSSNPDGHAVIHFDCEQSRADHYGLVETAFRRVGMTEQPSWIRSYLITDIPVNQRMSYLEFELERALKQHGGIHSFLLDGVADLLFDPNDSAESFNLVEKLQLTSIKYDTSIVCVLHYNPGTELAKTRGHLGSQLERKAETNLALEKTDGITVVYTKLARHAHIEKSEGARFQWNAELSMHTSCHSFKDEDTAHDEFHLQAIVDEIFEKKQAVRYSDLKLEVMRIKNVKDKTAEKTIQKLVPKYIKKSLFGAYEIS